MRRILFFILVFCGLTSFGFEGVVHCVKIQNGQEIHFDFFIKNNKVAIISDGIDGMYKIILDRESKRMVMCVDHSEMDKKGYFTWEKGNFKKTDSLVVFGRKDIAGIEIDGEFCKGYSISTDGGGAVGYFSNKNIDLRGFSTYLNDPVYELLDELSLSTLPKRLLVSKSTGNYTIELTEESKSLDDSYFTIPSGYIDLNIKSE